MFIEMRYTCAAVASRKKPRIWHDPHSRSLIAQLGSSSFATASLPIGRFPQVRKWHATIYQSSLHSRTLACAGCLLAEQKQRPACKSGYDFIYVALLYNGFAQT